jgi:hypothetical protein
MIPRTLMSGMGTLVLERDEQPDVEVLRAG